MLYENSQFSLALKTMHVLWEQLGRLTQMGPCDQDTEPGVSAVGAATGQGGACSVASYHYDNVLGQLTSAKCPSVCS